MSRDVAEKTRKTAELYFDGLQEEKPYEIWKAFDRELARDMSLFITGQMYAREKIPHATRQLVTIATLTALGKTDELRLHINAALNVGCTTGEIAEVMFQTFTYGGVPNVNMALKTLRTILKEKGLWPPEQK